MNVHLVLRFAFSSVLYLFLSPARFFVLPGKRLLFPGIGSHSVYLVWQNRRLAWRTQWNFVHSTLQKYFSWLHNWLLIKFCSHNNLDYVNMAVPFCPYLIFYIYPLHFVCLFLFVKRSDPWKAWFWVYEPNFFLYLMILLLRGQPKIIFCLYMFHIVNAS